jgi:hypothetical protein
VINLSYASRGSGALLTRTQRSRSQSSRAWPRAPSSRCRRYSGCLQAVAGDDRIGRGASVSKPRRPTPAREDVQAPSPTVSSLLRCVRSDPAPPPSATLRVEADGSGSPIGANRREAGSRQGPGYLLACAPSGRGEDPPSPRPPSGARTRKPRPAARTPVTRPVAARPAAGGGPPPTAPSHCARERPRPHAARDTRDRSDHRHGGDRPGRPQRGARRHRRPRHLFRHPHRNDPERRRNTRDSRPLPQPVPAGSRRDRGAVAGARRDRRARDRPRTLTRPRRAFRRRPPRLLRRPDAVQHARRAALDVGALPSSPDAGQARQPFQQILCLRRQRDSHPALPPGAERCPGSHGYMSLPQQLQRPCLDVASATVAHVDP